MKKDIFIFIIVIILLFVVTTIAKMYVNNEITILLIVNKSLENAIDAEQNKLIKMRYLKRDIENNNIKNLSKRSKGKLEVNKNIRNIVIIKGKESLTMNKLSRKENRNVWEFFKDYIKSGIQLEANEYRK